MQSLLYKISEHPKYSKIYTRGKLISVTGGGQIIVQLLGLLCGITIIRLLPTKEYAYYTLANTVLGTMTVLADGGISNSVMAQGGKVWQDKKKLGVVLATGLGLRKRLAKQSLLISIPALIYFLLHLDAGWLTTVTIVLALIPAFLSALSDSILESPLKLHQDIGLLQKNQIFVAVGRLVFGGLSLIFFPFTFVALLSNGIPRILGNIGLRKLTFKFALKDQKPDLIIKARILENVKRILPGTIYYCLSGQLTVWLISIFGGTTSVAQIGALTRLSMVLSFVTILFAQLVVPRFARMKNKADELLKRFLQIQGILILLTLIILGLVYVFPHQILWILGKGYSDLNIELILSVFGSCIALMAGISFNLFASRGWAIRPVLSLPISVISIFIGILIFNMSTLTGVLLFNILTASVQYFLNSGYCLFMAAQEK